MQEYRLLLHLICLTRENMELPENEAIRRDYIYIYIYIYIYFGRKKIVLGHRSRVEWLRNLIRFFSTS